MIDSKELRIGNWVANNFGNHIEVGGVYIAGIDPFATSTPSVLGEKDIRLEPNYYYDEIKPIPITEELLIKAGFTNYEWCEDCAFIKFQGQHMFIRFYDNKWHCTKTRVTKDEIGHATHGHKDIVKKGLLKHLHQLQNLFFALTGKELNIEL